MSFVSVDLQPYSIPFIVKQVNSWPEVDRARLISELRQRFETAEKVDEDWKSADPEDLLAEIWAELPENGVDITDEELNALKTKRRREKFG